VGRPRVRDRTHNPYRALTNQGAVVKRLAVLAIIAIAAAGACSSSGSKSSSTTTTPRDWSPAALKVADGLKDKLLAAKKTCTDYIHWDYKTLITSYSGKGLPAPAAVTACQGDAQEDLTTEVFADAAAKTKYVEAKQKLLCDASAKKKLGYPGFPYVDGGTWIFEPDTNATAVDAQKVLGGTVKTAACKT
jgi:hypothetical protein